MATASERQRAYRERQKAKLAEVEQLRERMVAVAHAAPERVIEKLGVVDQLARAHAALRRIAELHNLDSTPHGEEVKKQIRKGLS